MKLKTSSEATWEIITFLQVSLESIEQILTYLIRLSHLIYSDSFFCINRGVFCNLADNALNP